MFQQLFVNKHYRLRDSKLTEWRSASGDRQNGEKKKQRVKHEPRSAHGRAVNKNRARPMAARLINHGETMNCARPMAARLIKQCHCFL